MKTNILRKLSSRKFWAMFIAFVTSILIFLNVERGTIESVVSIIGTLGSLVIYMLVEGAVDAAGAKAIGTVISFDGIDETEGDDINANG